MLPRPSALISKAKPHLVAIERKFIHYIRQYQRYRAEQGVQSYAPDQ